MGKSIAIVQTSAVSSTELSALCKEIIPDVKVWEIIDNSLIAEVNANGGVTKAVRRRLLSYYENAQSLGVDAILNQCSSVSEVAEDFKKLIDIPIVKIDEAMAREAVRLGKKIGVIATVETTLGPSCSLIENAAKQAGKEIEIVRYLVEGAMMIIIEQGDKERHNAMVIGEVERAARECDVVVLAQGSMTVLLPLLTHIKTPVLSSPRMGIEYLKEVLGE